MCIRDRRILDYPELYQVKTLLADQEAHPGEMCIRDRVNPDQKLPDKEISPVYRSDGSGTTNVFSDYLTKVSPDWATQIGTGKSLKWPTGMAARCV